MSKKLDDEINVIKEGIDKIVCHYDVKNLYNTITCLFMYQERNR